MSKTKIALSYSGGKDSALALYYARKSGLEPVRLVTTYNKTAGRSWFHGIPRELLDTIAKLLDIPLEVAVIGADDSYELQFEAALERVKAQGARMCVFGDIDIEAHHHWCDTRCKNAGLDSFFPLWQRNRRELVYELIDSGHKALITIVDTTRLGEKYLGRTLTRELADEIEACGADICGENGEYHSFVYDGPLFAQPVPFKTGAVVRNGNYSILPVLP